MLWWAHVFDSVLLPQKAPKSRFGAGAIVTVAIHAGVIGAVMLLSSRSVEPEQRLAEVKFFSGRAPAPGPVPAPPPPAAASAAAPTPTVEKKAEKRPRKVPQIIPPKEIPQEKPKEEEPEPQPPPEPPVAGPVVVPAMATGEAGGVVGGQVGGVQGGQVGGVVGGTGSGTDVLPFGEGMTRPANIKTPPAFQCPREAREAAIDGVLLASCTVTLEGDLRDCKIVKSLPFMDGVALDLLARWRVGPVTYQGRPVMVNYKIPIRMVCR